MEYLDDDVVVAHHGVVPVNIILLEPPQDLVALQQDNIALREKVARLEEENQLLRDTLMY